MVQLLPLLRCRTSPKRQTGWCTTSSKESAEKWAEPGAAFTWLLPSGKERLLLALLESVTTAAPCRSSSMCEDGKTKHCWVCGGETVLLMRRKGKQTFVRMSVTFQL